MKHQTSRRVVFGALTCALAACGTAPPPPASSPGEMPMPVASATPAPRVDRDDAVPLAPHVHVDTKACDPAGKSVVVTSRDAEGRPSRWRYFATHHGRRVLSCEAADANGDGRIDARYFYDPSGRLVLEQRDLDFDGNAEVVADYSQFRPRRRLAHAGGARR